MCCGESVRLGHVHRLASALHKDREVVKKNTTLHVLPYLKGHMVKQVVSDTSSEALSLAPRLLWMWIVARRKKSISFIAISSRATHIVVCRRMCATNVGRCSGCMHKWVVLALRHEVCELHNDAEAFAFEKLSVVVQVRFAGDECLADRCCILPHGEQTRRSCGRLALLHSALERRHR